MATPDLGHQQTDKLLDELERRLAAVYRTAGREMQAKIDAYFESFRERDEQMKALIGTEVNGKIWTERDYKQWRLAQIGRGSRFEALRDALAERMTKANEVAAAYINDATPGVYSLNRNYTAYTIERVGGNIGFTLWDESTVKRLLKEQPDLMPYYPPQRAVKRGIDLEWGKKIISSQLTQSILQGENLKQMADRLKKNIPTMERDSAIRAARTAFTGAQNAGRMDSYKAAEDMGIKVQKRWVATKDGRTRHSHRRLDGETVAWDAKFSNGCRYPGDPQGKPAEVYNCRCTMRTVEKPGIEAEPRKMRVRDPKTGRNVVVEEMTYEQWESWKKTGSIPSPKRKVFVAKSIEEAEEYAKENIFSGYLGAKTSYRGIDLEAANEMNAALYNVIVDYQKKPAGLEFVGSKTASGKKKLGGNSEAVFATNPLSGTLYGNKDILKTKTAFEKYIQQANDAFDYVIQNKNKLSGSQRALAEVYEKAGKSLVRDTIEGMITHEYGHFLVAEINPSRGLLQAIKDNMGNHVISGYSQHSVSEYLAECFVEYRLGDKSKLDKTVVQLFDEAVIK